MLSHQLHGKIDKNPFLLRCRFLKIRALTEFAGADLFLVCFSLAEDWQAQVREGKVLTRDLGGRATTKEFADAVIAHLA